MLFLQETGSKDQFESKALRLEMRRSGFRSSGNLYSPSGDFPRAQILEIKKALERNLNPPEWIHKT